MVAQEAENSPLETPARKAGAAVAVVLLFTQHHCLGQPPGQEDKTIPFPGSSVCKTLSKSRTSGALGGTVAELGAAEPASISAGIQQPYTWCLL